MTIIQQPDALSLSYNIRDFRISSTASVSFVLKKGDVSIVAQTYEPGQDGYVTIKVRDIIHAQLAFVLQTVGTMYEQPDIVADFTAVIDTTEVTFRAIRSGVENFADTAANFLTANWLTWQPQEKPVTYASPEFLTYYAVIASSCKLKAYYTNDAGNVTAEETITVGALTEGKAYTIPMQYAAISTLLGGKLPAFYDVWIEDGSGNRLTYIQRYYAGNMKSEQEDWILFENSLGGIDTFRAYGATNFTGEHTHNIAEIDEVSEEYRVDTQRKYQKNTGYLNMRERHWLLDFFPSAHKLIYTAGALRAIVVTDSDVTYQDKELPSSYTFTYKYADAKPLLNIARTSAPAEVLNIAIPDLGNFTVPPRLVELASLPLTEGALFPVQSPYDEAWKKTTAGALFQFIANKLTNNYNGGGGIGHTHNNLDLLQLLSYVDDYLEVDSKKIKAGYADDFPDEIDKIKTFLKGLTVGENVIDSLISGMGIILDKDGRIQADRMELRSLLTVIGLISAGKGVQFGNFMTGIQGGYIDEKGNGELDSLEIRKRLFVPEIAYNRITYFKGRMVNSPGGGCTVKSVVANSDGTYTVTPDLTSADGLSQFKDDILTTYFTTKDANGHLQGFEEMKFRVVSADYNAKTFVMAPRPGFSYKPAEQMILAQTGNFTDADRQTYILIDSVNGNNCITFFDNANTWDVEPSQEKSWFGKKKGRTINGIPADDYNAVMRNIIMTGKIFQVDDITGEDIRVPIDKGNWVAGKYAYYDRVSHNGKLWLCVAESGTETEPAASEPAWLLQVDSGASITSYAHWENDQTPYPANTILSFANKIWISKRETSEAPYPLLLDHKGDRLKQTQDGGQTYGYTYYVEKQSDDWNLLLDAESLTKGKDGESLEVRYSSDKQSWHSTFVEGDVWMQQRLGATSWSAAMRIVGEAGTDAQWQDFQFAVGNSLSVAPSTGWQDAPPTVSTGQYLWMRTGWVTPPATAPASWVSVRIGGEKGLGIASVDVEYAIGTSATTSPTWGWQTTSPAWEDGKYIWSRTKIVYTDNSVKYSQEACITGGKGTTGKGISSIVEEYYQSSSPTSLTDGLWTTTRPTWENNKYIWTRSKIVYTDATTSMTDAICVTGGKGESVTNVGRWHTGLHVPNLGITTMGGSSWICKKQGGTDNPPLWTDITNGGNRILQTQDGWKTYGYVLTGERNTEEYDLIASDGKDTEIAYLISTVSNISVSSSGTLVPSSFAVYAKKNKGGTTTAYTEGYLCARGFSNGTWGVIVSPTKASQINVSASTGYAMYSTRLYASQSDAAAWNDNFSSEISVGITYNGKNGDRGPTGAMLRSRGQYVSGNTYLWDEKFRDVILYSFNNVWRAFVIKAYGSSTTSAPTSVDGDANWDAFQQFQNVATDILLSRQIKADEIDVKSLVVENVSAKDANGNVTTKIDGSTGELTSKKAILEDALVQGKIVTALNGKRVEINPANNSLSLFNENGKEVCNLSFLSENWNGAVNSFPRLSLKQYHNTTLVSEIEFTQGQMSASMRSGNDLFEAAFNPMSGITFIKNDAVQMFYPAKKN